MKVMVIVKATNDSEAGVMPSQELLIAMGAYNEELARAGLIVDGAGLKPSSAGARVRFSGESRMVVDGPFTETKELIAGYWIWKVSSMQEAIDWVKKCPNPMSEDSDIEIRPFFEADDFGEAFTPELREQEASVLARTLGLNPPRFEDGPALALAGFNCTYTLETRAAIPLQWEKFIHQAATIPGFLSAMTYGVCWNTQPGGQFDYLTAAAVTEGAEFPADFTRLNLEASRYAVFMHDAHVSLIPTTIETIWTKWVPECGLKIGRAPCYERYTAAFNPQTGLGGMEIWIPLDAPELIA